MQARQQAAAKATRTASVSTATSTHDAALASYLADWTNSNIDAKTLAINARATAIATSSGAKNLANYNFGTNAPVSIGGITGSGTVTGSGQSPFAFVGYGGDEKPPEKRNYNFPEYPSEGKTPNRAASPPDVQVDPSLLPGHFTNYDPDHLTPEQLQLRIQWGGRDTSWYAYLGGTQDDAFDTLVDAATAVGDEFTFGGSYVLRDHVVGFDTVNYDGQGYYWGGWGGFVIGIVNGKSVATGLWGLLKSGTRILLRSGDDVAKVAVRSADDVSAAVKEAVKSSDGLADNSSALGKLEKVAPKTGAWTAGFDNLGRGLGKLAGKQVTATRSGLDTIRDHLSKLDPSDANAVMLRRIEDAIEAGRPLEGADAVFYTHEIVEQAIMKSRLASHGGDYLDHYSFAHGKVLEIYGNSPFSVYHPEAILADDFLRTNSNWLKFWRINP